MTSEWPELDGYFSDGFPPYVSTLFGDNLTGTTLQDDNDDEEEILDLDLTKFERARDQATKNIASVQAERTAIQEQIASLQRQLERKDKVLEDEIEKKGKADRDIAVARANARRKGKGKETVATPIASGSNDPNPLSRAGPRGITNYLLPLSWEKDDIFKNAMRQFGVEEFRLCQRGVVNAALQDRDIVVVMPTGGGKSLTYQLPAILTAGLTLVISPLLSLISDQVYHLRRFGVEAVKQTGSTSKSDQDAINARLGWMARLGPPDARLGQPIRIGEEGQKEIKLLYCTPEKISKSKRFQGILQKLADAKRLARIVIDEAHCVSQLGHDFRPDYQKLHILRQLFPNVPIMALSATCPPLVLKDLLKILRLRPTVPGDAADSNSTVYFTSPLYRPNLHYQVLPKPSESNKVYDEMTKWILSKHKEDSGIVYCLSKKDTEKVATELRARGNIQTGVYHADRTDKEKEDLHSNWQKGKIKVVCATIAFGLGIDKGDVRFVIHHSLSKSLDGFYQESGRAGRDGKDSDCVLYYRAQDASTLSSMSMTDKDGASKLHAMLTFVQDLKECRKIQFANYFSHTSNISITSWSTSDLSAREPCGHCDNCTRPADSCERKDVTVQAWQLLNIAKQVQRDGGNATLSKLAELARSTGKGSFIGGDGGGGGGGGRKRGRRSGGGKEQVELDLDVVCGGKVNLKREDVETLLVELLLRGYLREQFQSTAYATIAYVQPGESATRLTRFLSMDSLKDLPDGSRIFCWFRVNAKTTKTQTKTKTKKNTKSAILETSASASAAGVGASTSTSKRVTRKGKDKAKAAASKSISDVEDIDTDIDGDGPAFDSDIDEQDDIEFDMETYQRVSTSTSKSKSSTGIELESSSSNLNLRLRSLSQSTSVVIVLSDTEGEESGSDWIVPTNRKTTSIPTSSVQPPRKRRRTEEIERGLEEMGDIIELVSSPPR